MPVVRRLCLPLFLIVACLLSGCRSAPLYVHPQFNELAPRLVAVMPPSNATSELVGAQLAHILMAKNIHRRGYRAISAAQVMSFLKTKGVSQGGQLGNWDDASFRWVFPKHLSAKKLCEDLKVDGLVMGHLTYYGEIITGFYNQRKVEIGWCLVTKDGTTIWMDNKIGITADVQTSKEDAKNAAIAHGVRKIAQTITETPLYREAMMATDHNLATLPRRVR